MEFLYRCYSCRNIITSGAKPGNIRPCKSCKILNIVPEGALRQLTLMDVLQSRLIIPIVVFLFTPFILLGFFILAVSGLGGASGFLVSIGILKLIIKIVNNIKTRNAQLPIGVIPPEEITKKLQ